jgi:exodeoxyribonuclease V beta subunit
VRTEPDSEADLRVRFATRVRAEVDRRKRALKILGFDDLLGRVRDALADETTGAIARERLRSRYRVVLVDEFQDTDPVQWDVLRLAFHGHRDLVVIGDPKQAIYAFRGADVRAYLTAKSSATTHQTLDTNWRSDARLVDGLATLFRGAALGHADIVVRPVQAAFAEPAVGPGVDPTPVRLRVLQRDGLPLTRAKLAKVDAAREAVAADVAAQVVETLGAGHTYTPRGGVAIPLTARHIAVLVRTGVQARLVREKLLNAGVPCVLTGTSSVFATSAARDWLLLLEALEQSHRSARVRRLALSNVVGCTAADLDAGGDAQTDRLTQQVREWSDVLAQRGVAGLFATVQEQTQLASRLLRRPDGERLVTDLRHVAESLHTESVTGQLGVAGLLSWLRARVEEADSDADQERSRRLDTDADAVQVATVHTSKGLEFPVVLVPFGWDATGGGKAERHPRGHDDDGRRTLHVGGERDAGYAEACAQQDAEEAGEELRLMYVAATRAISRLVLWWAPSTKTPRGPLHRLLLAADPTAITAEVAVPGDDALALVKLRDVTGAGSGGIAVEAMSRTSAMLVAPTPAGRTDIPLRAAEFSRSVDLRWRRTSYTALTASAHGERPVVGSEPEIATKDDEADVDALRGADADAGDEPLKAITSPMADLPGGRTFGTLVHAVLEEADLRAATDVREELRAVAERELMRRGGAMTADELADALLPVVRTPVVDGLRLVDFDRRDRLAELDFELPLAGGDAPVGDVSLRQVGSLLAAHLDAGDRVRPYADLLRDLGGLPLRGYLGGSVDAVLRVGGRDDPRYVVVDYKTNRLADRDVALTAWHYRASALDAAMRQAHYPLQALLYYVALHRFLRWRQPSYDPARHLGGVRYLFLRGMCGDTEPVTGVWSWRPPAEAVVALSDLLAGRAA